MTGVAAESVSESTTVFAGDADGLVLGVVVPLGPAAGSAEEVDFSAAAWKGTTSPPVEGMAKSYTELTMLGRNLGSEKILGTWEGRQSWGGRFRRTRSDPDETP